MIFPIITAFTYALSMTLAKKTSDKDSLLQQTFHIYIGSFIGGSVISAYIYNLAVDKNFRNKGIGNKLIVIALYIAKLKKYSYVQAHCDNEASAHLFKKNKFSIENIFQNDKVKTIKLMTSWL